MLRRRRIPRLAILFIKLRRETLKYFSDNDDDDELKDDDAAAAVDNAAAVASAKSCRTLQNTYWQ